MPDFAPGQRWTYATRPGEETSTVLILAVESAPQDTVILLDIDGLQFRSPGGLQTELQHVTVNDESLRASVHDLIEIRAAAPGDAYAAWHREARADAGTHATMTLAEMLDSIQTAVDRQQDAPAGDLFRKSNRG